MNLFFLELLWFSLSFNSSTGHGLWVWQYGEKKKPVFDVPGPDGKYLSPVLASVYLFLTAIIVFQVYKLYIMSPVFIL